jgi:hypothetical protein
VIVFITFIIIIYSAPTNSAFFFQRIVHKFKRATMLADGVVDDDWSSTTPSTSAGNLKEAISTLDVSRM